MKLLISSDVEPFYSQNENEFIRSKMFLIELVLDRHCFILKNTQTLSSRDINLFYTTYSTLPNSKFKPVHFA